MINLLILEGFDGVGKGAVVDKVTSTYLPSQLNKGVATYNYDRQPLDDLGSLSSRWLAGYYALDFIDNILDKDDCSKTVVFDRAIASSWVYDRLYSDGSHITDEIVYKYLDKLGKLPHSCTTYYVKHLDENSAEKIFNQKDVIEQFDAFDSFSSYWKTYKLCCSLYEEFFTKFKVPHKIYYSMSDSTGNRVKLLERCDKQ